MQNKISRRQFLQVTGASTAALLLAGLPVEASAASGHLTVTPDTLVSDLRADPTFAASGVWTWQSAVDSPDTPEAGTTLSDYVGANMAQDSADALNYLADTYEAGTQVTYKVYSPEEIAADSSLGCVQLFWFPGTNADGKYALVVGGNAAMKSGDLNEGIAVAAKLNKMGYSVFVLRYRILWGISNNGPLQDLGRAVQFITNHAQQFGVQPENYALVGFSSGGQLCGLFSSDKRYGYKAYDVPKPGALLMGYPVNDFAEIKPVYHVVMDPASCRWRYYWSDISGGITPDFPPTCFWYGKNDVTLKTLGYPFQGPAVRKALEANGVPCEVHVYENAPHAIGTGNGTDAEGWMTDAVAFWEQYTS